MLKILVPTFLLSLIVWVAFYCLGWRLLASETVVVTGLCLMVVVLVDRLRRKFVKRHHPDNRAVEKKIRRSGVAKAILIASLAASAHKTVAARPLCNIERPTALEGGHVRLWVLSDSSDLGGKGYKWAITVGAINGSGTDVQWNLSHVPHGMYTAKLMDSSSSSQSEICSVRLFVVETTRGSTARGLLVRGQEIPSGYGLYTFLAFASPPAAGSHDRYLAAITAYLRLSPSLDQLDGVMAKQELNANFVPVDSSPMGDFDAEWVLRHYDYARARALLSVVADNYFGGPYLLSSPHVGVQGTVSSPFLFQNLSIVPPHLIGPWYESFLVRATQQNASAAQSLKEMALWIRTAVSILAIAVPDVEVGVSKWIKFIQ